MPDTRRARYEEALGRARRNLSIAMEAADELNDYGSAQDLSEMQHHIVRMMQESLDSKRRVSGQQSLC